MKFLINIDRELCGASTCYFDYILANNKSDTMRNEKFFSHSKSSFYVSKQSTSSLYNVVSM